MSPITPDGIFPGTVLERSLRRDRVIVLAALFILTALAWGYLIWQAQAMHMSMPGMADTGRAWMMGGFALTFMMWVVMMVGMMTASAAPMILIYARVGRQAAERGQPLAASGFFAAGYLIAWTLFALAATVIEWLLYRALLLTPMLVSANAVFSGGVLIVAGVYQWTPIKHTCLRHCQAPLAFIQRHGGFRGTVRGSLALGMHHGLYCIGCCWALMALLFVGGVMNLLTIALLAALVLAEKLLPAGRWFPRTTGALLGAAGTWLLATGV